MSSFSEDNFVSKLAELNNSQQSIQTLSLWLIHHRKHAAGVVQVWYRELQKVKPSKKLTFMYLANDVIQNSRKKGNEFLTGFSSCLEDAYKHTADNAEEKTLGALTRLCDIWKQRSIFDEEFIGKLREELAEDAAPKKEDLEAILDDLPDSLPDVSDSPREPPDVDELVKALLEVENSASSDATIREKIAALPAEVSEVSLLEKVKDKVAADRLQSSVEAACSLLDDYNGRLDKELDDRRLLAAMLRDFIAAQKDQLASGEVKLEEYRTKLEQVRVARKELTSHIQNLPDLTLLPDVTGGLPPLPSAGDLFNIEKELNI